MAKQTKKQIVNWAIKAIPWFDANLLLTFGSQGRCCNSYRGGMKNHGHARQITKTSTPPSSIIFNAGAISVKVSVSFLWHQLVQVRSCEVEYLVFPMESRDDLTTLYRHCRCICCICKIIHIHHSTGSTDPWTNSTHPGLKSKDNARVLSSSFNRFSSNSVWCWCFSWTPRPITNQMTTNQDCLIFESWWLLLMMLMIFPIFIITRRRHLIPWTLGCTKSKI